MKLGLGTAQFGLDYGLTNAAGRVAERDIAAILMRAFEKGVSYVDTAPAYGCAEEVLGRLLPPNMPVKIINKTRHFAAKDEAESELRADLEDSLRRLRRDALYGLIAHGADDLLGPYGDKIWTQLEAAREAGLVTRIGASVYDADQIDRLLSRYPLDLIQLPINVMDQRLLDGGQLQTLKARGVEIHARSLYLQGVLLADPAQLPPYLSSLAPKLRAFRKAAQEVERRPLDLAIAFARLLGRIDVAVLGVTSVHELNGLVEAMEKPVPAIDFAAFKTSDPHLVDPRHWQNAQQSTRRAS